MIPLCQLYYSLLVVRFIINMQNALHDAYVKHMKSILQQNNS